MVLESINSNKTMILHVFFFYVFSLLKFNPKISRSSPFSLTIAFAYVRFSYLSICCHIQNIKCFFEPFIAQNNPNMVLESFYLCFLPLTPKQTIFNIFPQNSLSKWPILPPSKSNIRCFLSRFLSQNIPYMVLESF